MAVKVSIAEAKSDFSRVLKRAQSDLVIVTHRGTPEAVILPYHEYERLRRLQAYVSMIRLAGDLEKFGVTATDLYEASRNELEERP